MTLEPIEGLSVDQLMEVRDRPLEETYKTHDVGEEILRKRLDVHGFEVEQHGDDERDVDGVYYGEGPDLALYDDGDLVCYVEIKCKEQDEWFGRCNLRHFKEYVNFSNEVDVPVFIWFALVERGSSVLHREAFVEVEDTGQIDGDVVDISNETVVFHEEDFESVDDEVCALDGSDIVEVRGRDTVVDFIPGIHGNDVIEIDDTRFRSFPHFLHRVKEDGLSERGPRTHVTDVFDEVQSLVENHVQPNPANEDILQLRSSDGRIGPQIEEESRLLVGISPTGKVTVVVDREPVRLGSIER